MKFSRSGWIQDAKGRMWNKDSIEHFYISETLSDLFEIIAVTKKGEKILIHSENLKKDAEVDLDHICGHMRTVDNNDCIVLAESDPNELADMITEQMKKEAEFSRILYDIKYLVDGEIHFAYLIFGWHNDRVSPQL